MRTKNDIIRIMIKNTLEIFMRIHTVKASESLKDIAQEYGIDEDILKINNGIGDDAPAEGEELLILTPTRTYITERGDTPERLALRFGVRRCDIMAMNPWIEAEGLTPGRRIALKYDERIYGTAASNGYFFSGTKLSEVKERLPYLTYVTVASAVAEGGEIRSLFNDRDVQGLVRSADKIPLIRIFIKDASCFYGDEEGFADRMVRHALSGGYKGVTLGSATSIPSDFLMMLRKKMIGCDLILITEAESESPESLSELSDGTVFSAHGYLSGNTLPFAEGDARQYEGYAVNRESSKAFIELPTLAVTDGGYVSVKEAYERAVA